MAATFSAWGRQREPAPGAGWTLSLLFALLAPTLTWPFALYLDFGLSSHACYPSGTPVPALRWSGLPEALKVINVVCFIVGLAALGFAAADWRRARHATGAPTSSGERNQSASVRGALALAAILVALVLCIGLLVNGMTAWLISHCALA